MSYRHDSMMVVDTTRIKEKFNWNTIIETGTDKGWSTEILSNIFDKVYTCEIDEERWQYYDELLQNPKIKILKGSSPDCLKQFIEEIGHGEFFLYLDAHWNTYWPILDELQVVIDYGYKPVIIIHDFDNGLGFQFDRYRDSENQEHLLNFEYVKEKIEQIYGKDGYIFETNKKSVNPIGPIGCAYFYPKQ